MAVFDLNTPKEEHKIYHASTMYGTYNRKLTKLVPTINQASDYIQWKLRIYAYIWRDHALLIGLSSKPSEDTNGELLTSLSKSTKAKRIIIISLGPSSLSQSQNDIEDDENTTKYAWDSLPNINTTSST